MQRAADRPMRTGGRGGGGSSPAEIARKDERSDESARGVLSRGAATMQMRETICTGAFARFRRENPREKCYRGITMEPRRVDIMPRIVSVIIDFRRPRSIRL